MLWELLAELRRRDNDKKFNKSLINKLHKKDKTNAKNSKFDEKEVYAESLQVGDIIKMTNLFLISS